MPLRTSGPAHKETTSCLPRGYRLPEVCPEAFHGYPGVAQSFFRGKKATANPWKSNALEWTTPINPGHGNWPGDIPKVYRWPYDYSKPGAPDDFIPQTVPFSETPESNLQHENESIALEVKDDDDAIIIDTNDKE